MCCPIISISDILFSNVDKFLKKKKQINNFLAGLQH